MSYQPDLDDFDIQCTAETPSGGGRRIHWVQCKNLVPDWDGNDEPLCEEHDEEARQMEAADLAVKAMKEDS